MWLEADSALYALFRLFMALQILSELALTAPLTTGDYIVDCAACSHTLLTGVDSYTCSVKCQVMGDSNMNVTGVYKLLEQLIAENKNMAERHEERLAAVEKKITNIAFRGALSGKITFQKDAIIKYDTILTNIGDAFDINTGKFVAPYNGTYQFIVTSMSTAGSCYVSLQLNGETQCATHSAGVNDSAVCTIVLQINQGDEVYVKGSLATREYNGKYNSFSGVAIQIDA